MATGRPKGIPHAPNHTGVTMTVLELGDDGVAAHMELAQEKLNALHNDLIQHDTVPDEIALLMIVELSSIINTIDFAQKRYEIYKRMVDQ